MQSSNPEPYDESDDDYDQDYRYSAVMKEDNSLGMFKRLKIGEIYKDFEIAIGNDTYLYYA